MKLIDVVANLASYDPELTIYVARPWTCHSEAMLACEPAEGGLPREAQAVGVAYFLEVFIATEFLESWLAGVRRPTGAREQCERLIHYAIHDA